MLGRGPAWERLEDQMDWYDRKSASNQRTFRRLKGFELVAAAAVPVVVSVPAAAWITACLGATTSLEQGAPGCRGAARRSRRKPEGGQGRVGHRAGPLAEG